jgi:hypothetical protein
MPGREALTTASVLQCPHGGTVQVITSNTKALAGAPIATAQDMPISGCPFQIPAVVPIPSPCILARWVKPDLRVQVNGSPSLSKTSVVLCFSPMQVPQGPAIVQSTQAKTETS